VYKREKWSRNKGKEEPLDEGKGLDNRLGLPGREKNNLGFVR